MFLHKPPTPADLRSELLAGLTTSLTLLPQALVLAFIAGLDPVSGIYCAVLMLLVTTLTGCRSGMVSGPSGAMGVVMLVVAMRHGVESMAVTVLLAGLMQLVAGALGLGRYLLWLPRSVLMGFVSGVAVLGLLLLLRYFQMPGEEEGMVWLQGPPLLTMLGLMLLTMLMVYFLPKWRRQLPAALLALLVVTLLVFGFDLDTRSLQDGLWDMTNNPEASVAAGLPTLNIGWPSLDISRLNQLYPYAVLLAMIGLIEALFIVRTLDEMDGLQSNPKRLCLGQGLANMANGLFGGMGGSAMLDQSLINRHAGGHGWVSTLAAALFLLLLVQFAAPLVEMIPLAALLGIQLMVLLGALYWAAILQLRGATATDAVIAMLVALAVVVSDLVLAVAVGALLSGLQWGWQRYRSIKE